MVERDFVIVCFENSVLCTGSQKETLALSCFTSCFKTSLLRTGKQKWPIVTFVSSFSGSRLLDNKINSYYYRQTRISLNKKLDRVDN